MNKDVNLPNISEEIEKEFAQLENVYKIVIEFFINYSFQIIGAIIVFLIGLWISHKTSRFVIKILQKNQVDITLSKFIANVVRTLVIIMVAIIALGKLGISVTPFIAAVGAASLGVGLALQGLLSNYAAGITIIITRPFIVGNTISVLGVTGVVKEIKLAMVILVNEEGEDISIPNKHILGEVINNSFEDTLAVTHIGISYDSDPELAIKLLKKVLEKNTNISERNIPKIGIEEFGDSAILIGIRYWLPTQKYYECKYQINLSLFQALKNNNIAIPFPQREVKILKD